MPNHFQFSLDLACKFLKAAALSCSCRVFLENRHFSLKPRSLLCYTKKSIRTVKGGANAPKANSRLRRPVGRFATGPLNKITDVPGVRVGHATIDTAQNKTGVTVLLPRPENPFSHQYPAASFVLNGLAKASA